jgi:glycosyltransferase involved in cell wall biosynthesis
VRIAVDARELQGRATGVGTFLGGILNEWATMPAAAAHHVILCAPSRIDSPLVDNRHVSSLWADGHGTWWEQRALPALIRQARADVLFAPGYTAPLLSPVPVVVAIHDVSFAAHPEWFGWREGLRRRLLTRLAAKRAACVVTISEFSKREIAAHLGIAPAKISVVYPAAARRATVATPESSSPGHSRNLVLFAGSLFNRRHIPELIEAFGKLARHIPDAELEIVGDNRTTPRIDFERLVAASGAGARISMRSYLPEAELAALYRRAGAFVFLSGYEGFGLTPLEALDSGVPIVVLDTPVAREVYGTAALYVERPDPTLLEASLRRVLTDDAERRRILEAAQGTLAKYSWRTCAEQILALLVSHSACRDSR